MNNHLVIALLALTPLASAQLPQPPEWSFDTARVQAITNATTKAVELQSQPVRGRYTQAEFTSKPTFPLPVVLEAEVRLPFQATKLDKPSRANASLVWLQSEGTGTVSHAVGIRGARGKDDYGYTASVRSGGDSAAVIFKPSYTIDDISPLMEENVRALLEQTVPQTPLIHERVHRLRLEVRAQGTWMFVNGRLVGHYTNAVAAGQAQLTLMDEARVVSLRVRPLEPVAEAFVPVPLDDFCNATGPGQPAGLPAERGRIGQIQGVPFITSTGFRGEDHLDLGASISTMCLASFREGDARESVDRPEDIQMTRFTMRVPAKPYRRAWILAADSESPNTVPVLSLRFYKPKTPWAVKATTTAPSFTATTASGQAKRVEMKGRSLWLIPIELDAAALAADPMDCLEVTKAIYPYRGYPDPAYYGEFPGGLPSGVQLYGLTLEEAPVWARGTGTRNANLYQDPEKPTWRVLLRNLTGKVTDAEVVVTVTDPYGKTSEHKQRVALKADRQQQEISIQPPAEKYGYYQVQTEVKVGDFRQARAGAFLRLPTNTRKATAVNSPWGLWVWNGGHKTNPDPEDNVRILKALGAIASFDLSYKPDPKAGPVSYYDLRKKEGIAPPHYRLEGRQMPAWSSAKTPDPEKRQAYVEAKGQELAEQVKLHPDLQYANVFAEDSISLRVTHGMSPWAMGQPWFDLDAREQQRLHEHWLTAKAAFEGARKYAPGVKLIFAHGAANFTQPFFLLPDWSDDWIDGIGLDLPQFERMPERQPRATEPSLLFFLNHQLKEKGLLGKKELIHLESYFPSTGPLALTDQEQAESIMRTAVLSLSLGTTKFLRTWSDYISGDGWGSSHYGSCGLIDRFPESNPKPAAMAYATMSQVLDLAKYDGWLETGSRSAYCIRFKDTDRLVYAVWTLRGTRPLTLTFDGTATRYDMHGNAFPVEPAGSITLSSTPQWIVVRGGAIKTATVGEPTYADAPAGSSKVVENFEAADWKYDAGIFERYQINHWDMPREPGQMQAQRVRNDQRKSNVFRVELTNPDQKKPMVGFYGVYTPPKPINIPGRAKALGLWVNGRSAWNRFIYEITDAKGEKWISCGTRDAWNCDDIHSWSSINHDGWRYMRFPLPSNAPGDNFREPDTTWWGSDMDGIVDLPVKLTKIMIEMRPQMVYADQMLPVQDLAIELDDLTVEYATAQDMTDEPVKVQQAAALASAKKELPALPNPHANLQATGVGAAPTMAKVSPTDEGKYEGNRLLIDITPIAGVKSYKGYVSVYPDGRGALPLGIDKQSKHRRVGMVKSDNQLLFDGLRPATPMYFFVTYVDANGKESKPSAIRQVVTKDEFPFK